MTKEEWLSTLDPATVLQALRGKRVSGRKWRLASVALCRQVWHLLRDERSRAAVEAAELYADRKLESAESMSIEEAAAGVVDTTLSVGDDAANAAAAAAVSLALWAQADYGTMMALQWTAGRIGRRGQIDVLGCVFGIPHRHPYAEPGWRTSTALVLAHQMYDARDFSLMPILADALEEAGCGDAEVLEHCRGEGPHVRGCWVVDLVLGNE